MATKKKSKSLTFKFCDQVRRERKRPTFYKHVADKNKKAKMALKYKKSFCG